jgi:hypothetical protein
VSNIAQSSLRSAPKSPSESLSSDVNHRQDRRF